MPKGLKSLARLLDELPFAPAVAMLFGAVAGILVLATPGWLFERALLVSSLPTVVLAAAASLGRATQVMSAIFAAAGTAGILWLLLRSFGLLMKPRGPRSRGHRIEPFYKPPGDEAEIVTQARRPLFANAELGVPALPSEALTQAHDELVLDMPIVSDASAASEHWAPASARAAAAFAPHIGKHAPCPGPCESVEGRESLAEGCDTALPGEVAGRNDLNRGSQLLH